jgi:opacity protein-like surface antigen
MKSRYIVTLAAVCSAWSLAAHADRDTGWEFGGELIYQDSQDIEGDNGSSASIDSDIGLALTFGYRFSERVELTMGLDWNNVDYTAELVSGTLPISIGVDGELESFTPRVGVNFNFMEGPFTPYVNGTIGYTFIDTNIPNGPPQTGCWWDPWWGYMCASFYDTYESTITSLSYAVGLRWDLSDSSVLKAAYGIREFDLDRAEDLKQDVFTVDFAWKF